MKAGEYLATYGQVKAEHGQLADFKPKEEVYLLRIPNTKTGALDIILPSNNLKFANHEKYPNMEIRSGGKFYLKKDVKAGDEATWYYGDEFEKNLRL